VAVSIVETVVPWEVYLQRYRAGEWRDRIFHDLILADVHKLGPRPTILDIGSGDGFDGDVPLQRSIARACGRFIGIEPDPAVSLGDYFTETHRCLFEDAPLAAGSVDLAYAVMVLEHLPCPGVFWDKLHQVLADDGIFWGLTIDARHLFSRISLWGDRLGFKNFYLDRVFGLSPDQGRYKNYPTYYRTNTPRQIAQYAAAFRSCECINFSRVGQWSSYLPRSLKAVADRIDRHSIRRGWPGTLLITRAINSRNRRTGL
jgi:SAM-dependent methyltransferase